jgi:hypothetical protein
VTKAGRAFYAALREAIAADEEHLLATERRQQRQAYEAWRAGFRPTLGNPSSIWRAMTLPRRHGNIHIRVVVYRYRLSPHWGFGIVEGGTCTFGHQRYDTPDEALAALYAATDTYARYGP